MGVNWEYIAHQIFVSLSSGTGEFAGDGFLVFLFGEMRIGAAGCRQTGVPGHEPQSLGHGPLLGECHFAESLDLNGMKRLKLHGNRSGFFRFAYALRDYGVTSPQLPCATTA